MIEVRRDRRLPLEAPHPVRIVGEGGVQDLERDDPAKGSFPCLVHRSETAAAEPLDDFKVTEPSCGLICLSHLDGLSTNTHCLCNRT